MAAPSLVQDAGLPMGTIIDTSVANTKLICEAQPGTLATDPYWRVQKIVTVASGAGSVVTITWAGTAPSFGKFDQKASDRLTLTYA